MNVNLFFFRILRGNHRTDSWLERVVVYEYPREPSHVAVVGADGIKTVLKFKYDKDKKILTIRKPGSNLGSEFKILIT